MNRHHDCASLPNAEQSTEVGSPVSDPDVHGFILCDAAPSECPPYTIGEGQQVAGFLPLAARALDRMTEGPQSVGENSQRECQSCRAAREPSITPVQQFKAVAGQRPP